MVTLFESLTLIRRCVAMDPSIPSAVEPPDGH
jgi:hypothetical protein